jgi:hypothetical protein
MKIYTYKNIASGKISFRTQDRGNGYYASYHPESGVPYADAWNEHHGTWDVPGAYEAEGGDIMVPYGDVHVPWSHIWPTKPTGATKED